MSKLTKYLLIGAITGFILGWILTFFFVDNTYNSSKKIAKMDLDGAKKDTLVQIYKAAFDKVGKDLEVSQKDRDFYKGKHDTLLKYSIELTNPKVTKKDKTDMILWIQGQNSSVK